MRLGDWVNVRSEWHQVIAVRMDRYVTGGLAIEFTFETGRPLRIPAVALVSVRPADMTRQGWSVMDDPLAGSPVHEVECTACHESPQPSDSATGQRDWCVNHVRRTGHTGYRTTVTGFLRVLEESAGGAVGRER